MSSGKSESRHEYAVSVGVYRVGLFLASLFLLFHLFVEPRRTPVVNPVIDAVVVMACCAVLGYLIGIVLWEVRRPNT